MSKIEYRNDNTNESIIIDTESLKGNDNNFINNCNLEVLKLELDGDVAKTVKTAAEIEKCYKTGKIIYAVGNIGAYIQIAFGLFLTPEQTGNEYVLYGYTKGDHANVENLVFTAPSADSVMSLEVSSLM